MHTDLPPLASIADRLAAGLGDLAVVAVIYLFMAAAFGEVSGTRMNVSISLSGVPFVGFFVLAIAYRVVSEARWGCSLGKWMAGIRVRTIASGTMTTRHALIRNGLRIVDVLPILYVVGLVAIVTSDRNQRIGDRVAGTVVVVWKYDVDEMWS